MSTRERITILVAVSSVILSLNVALMILFEGTSSVVKYPTVVFVAALAALYILWVWTNSAGHRPNNIYTNGANKGDE